MAADSEGARKGEPKTKVFISYSRKDMAFADRLEAALGERGFEPLVDREEIYAFEDWWARIQALIAQADTVIFVLSPDSVASPVCAKEVTFAASLNKRFAPVVVQRVADKLVPEALARLNFIFFDNDAQFAKSFDRLCDALQTDIEWIRQHTEYGEAERRWSAAGRPNGLLLRSPTLEVAEHWLASRPRGAPEPTAEIRTFVAASRQGTRSVERLRRIVQASIFTLLVAIILGLVGWIKQDFLKAQWYWWTKVWPFVLGADQERALKPGQSFYECKDCPVMIVVRAGAFQMGSLPANDVFGNDPNAFSNEFPRHPVTIGRPFAVGKFDVTFHEWDACVAAGGCDGYRPEDMGWGRGQRPAINVTWNEAKAYVAWLSQTTGKTYRLLSESEWEYAARAGTTTAYYWGNLIGTNNADCDGCKSQWDGKSSAPAGSFAPNPFGLYDMAGNVGQWVEDCYNSGYEVVIQQGRVDAPADGSAWRSGDCGSRVVRGGSWQDTPPNLRSAYRLGPFADVSEPHQGFRVARTLDTR